MIISYTFYINSKYDTVFYVNLKKKFTICINFRVNGKVINCWKMS